MSSKNPLLKEFKGYATRLLTDCPKPITDEEDNLVLFCECLERILYDGLLPHKTVIAVIRITDCWNWLEKLGQEKVPFAYTSCVDDVKNCQRVQTNRGRVRLLIRHCLVKKCLHIPVDFIMREGRCCLLYAVDTVLGNSILASVLASTLSCISTSAAFKLDLNNTMFLDTTWNLPVTANITFVPTKTVGLTVIFVNGRAVICQIVEDSVAAENGTIVVGDLLDSVNGVTVDGKSQGSLARLLKKSSNLPINVLIIKAVRRGQLYGPIIPLIRQAGLDPAVVHLGEPIRKPTEGGEDKAILFLGSVSTGPRGDVKQIQTAINSIKPDRPIPVTIECHHLGIRVVSVHSKQVIDDHTYMEISSCGCGVSSSVYFGYIAGDKNYAECKNFVCYVFSSKNQRVVDNLLKTIGQGFRRTLYTV